MVIKKDIIYPMFIECLQFCENTFWSSIFEDLAYGRCPYGTYIHKNFFSCNYKGKEFSYKVDEPDPQTLYQNIFNLLTKKIGIISDEEKKNKLLEFYNFENSISEIKYDKWSSIKKKNVKDSLIENFLLFVKKEFNLSWNQIKDLQKSINLGLIFKTISHKDINLKDGKIESINGITFSNKNYSIDINLIDSDDNELCVEQPVQIPYLPDLWRKYYFSEN
jgi:hypothetical protein